MYRATTPHHIFTFPVEVSNFKEIEITYEQRKQIVLQKKIDDMLLENNVASYYLTQEEANLFTANIPVYIQVRVMTFENKVIASTVREIPCKKILDDSILVS